MGKSPTIFMTGATSGLGKEAALELAINGAKVIAASRSLQSGATLIEEFEKLKSDGKGQIELIDCDLCSFSSIEAACKKLIDEKINLDQIILNAGVWHFDFHESKNGIEEILQVNLLAPFLIILRIRHLLNNPESSKIILTSSGLHQGGINFDDIEFRANYSGFKAYRQSKLGIILITKYFSRLLSDDSIAVYCQHPGVVQTNLGRHANWFSRVIFKLIGKKPKKGAQTLLYLSNKSKDQLTTGAYYSNSRITKSSKTSYNLNLASKLVKVIESYLNKR